MPGAIAFWIWLMFKKTRLMTIERAIFGVVISFNTKPRLYAPNQGH